MKDSCAGTQKRRFGHSAEDAALDWMARRDRGLTTQERQELEAWLSADPDHGAAMAKLAATWASMDRPRKTGATDRVLAAVQLHTRRRQRRTRRLFALAGAACAVMAVLFSVGNWGSNSSVPLPRQAAVIVPRQDVMPDGSVAQLKDGSQIALAFSQAERHVNLVKGTAHFEVVKDAERPFVVTAGEFSIRAVGTAFSVQIAAEGVQVIVTEGKVAVERRGNAGSPATSDHSSFLEAGQRMDLEPRMVALPAPVAVSPAEIAERLSWREPRLEFSGTPLSEAVAILNQRNRLQLHVDDRAIADMQVSGVFRANNVEEFVLVLETGFGVAAERRSESDIILRKAR